MRGKNMKDVINYTTYGTCCKQMRVEIEDNIIKDVEFLGGCSGNLQGIKSLVIGMNINDVAKKLKGIDCNSKGTSCPDQLAICLGEYIKAHQKTTV